MSSKLTFCPNVSQPATCEKVGSSIWDGISWDGTFKREIKKWFLKKIACASGGRRKGGTVLWAGSALCAVVPHVGEPSAPSSWYGVRLVLRGPAGLRFRRRAGQRGRLLGGLRALRDGALRGCTQYTDRPWRCCTIIIVWGALGGSRACGSEDLRFRRGANRWGCLLGGLRALCDEALRGCA